MPNPEPITRIIIRRGTEEERKGVLLLQSEPGYSIDSRRLYIGDGSTYGGVPVGIKFLGFQNFSSINSNVPVTDAPLPNDLVFDNISNILYALTGTDYTKTSNYRAVGINVTADNITIQRVGTELSVRENSLNARYFTEPSIGTGLVRTGGNQVLRVAPVQPELNFVGNSLGITDAGVQNKKLAVMPPNTVKGVLSLAGSPQDISIEQVVSVDNVTINKQDSSALQIKDKGVSNIKLADMPGATVKGRLTTSGTPQDIAISDILKYQDLFFSIDIRGLSVTGAGSNSVVEILNTIAPPSVYPAGLLAHIAGTSQNWQPAVYQTTSFRQISRTVTVTTLVQDAGMANPTRRNNILYRINTGKTSWEYISG